MIAWGGRPRSPSPTPLYLFTRSLVRLHLHPILKLFRGADPGPVIHVSGGCDAVLLSGRDGVNTIWYNKLEKKWVIAKVNDGLPQEGGEQLGSPLIQIRY